MKRHLLTALLLAATVFGALADDTKTHRQYLSGTGCDDMVEWDFQCTDGRNAGKWTKIGVPSCWELQGFGTYQYGMRFYGKAVAEGIADEKGLNFQQQRVLGYLRADRHTTAAKIAADLGMSARQIERMLADMKAKGIIRRIGANRNGYWEIVDD